MPGLAASDLPVIQIGDTTTPENLEALRAACLQHGMGLLCFADKPLTPTGGGHHIAPEKIDRIWGIAKQLFDVSPEAKLQVHVKNSKNHRGYFSSVDYSEFNQDPEVRHTCPVVSN